MNGLTRMYFPTKDIKISVVMKREDILQEIEQESRDIVPKKVLEVYGEVMMPPAPEDRPYTFASIVLSSDGKMAYPDDPQGPLIAGKNLLDKEGGLADFWVLNMLRAYSDATIIGARTLQAEPKGTSHVFCKEMAEARVKEMGKKTNCPWNVIVSFDGTDIPLEHMIFDTDEIEVRIGTSPQGAEYLQQHMTKPHLIFGPYKEIEEVDISEIQEKMAAAEKHVPIFATGEGDKPDSKILLYILRKLGIEKLCIESPSYMFHLLENEAMDEMFINYSAVFVGGNITMGSYMSFSVNAHPHAHILMLGHHRSNFIFTRQKIYYGIKE
jgi:riboflavin biosynthesis pyrimidine reductase